VLRTVILALALIALLLTSEARTQAAVAKGFTKCSRVQVAGGSKSRVVVRGVPCAVGHTVARDYYQRIYDGDTWDGRASDGSIYYAVDGFRCGTGLGGSEAFCHHGRKHIDMSIRTDERWPY